VTELDYPFTIRPLNDADGGSYLIEFPDLPGCMSDGDTIDQAIANGADALRGWIAAMQEAGRPIPPPPKGPDSAYSGKWQQRMPKSLHRRLAERANQEGVSLNTLVIALVAEGLGHRELGKPFN
jgi:antitoxin HicB